MKTRLIIYMLILIAVAVDAVAWNAGKTHPKITEKAIDKSNIGNFLKTKLNMPNGYDEELLLKIRFFDRDVKDGDEDFKTEKVAEWIEFGSFKEDDPMCRAGQHFHDPIRGCPNYPVKEWSESGLDDYVGIAGLLVDGYCELDSFASGITGGEGFDPDGITSNLTWATGFKAESSSEPDTDILDLNDWDWTDARKDFYIYLTGRWNGVERAGNKNERETHLIGCLRSLGQVLHLLQDVGVPAHTRNDFSTSHTNWIWDKFFEWFPPKFKLSIPIGNYFEEQVAYHPYNAWFNGAPPSGLIDPTLTDFWDTNSYFGYNPLHASGVGLAEYSNYNYISQNTNFKPVGDDYYYPNPNLANTTFEELSSGAAIPETTSGDSVYVNNKSLQLKYTTSHTETIDSFARLSYWSKYVSQSDNSDITTREAVYKSLFWLDKGCYDNYAQYIIPRTIGYSKELINYFFRGTMDIRVLNYGENGDEITTMMIEALNKSGDNEYLNRGKLTLSIRYKKFTETEYNYIVVENPDIVHIPYTPHVDNSQNFAFDLASNPLPIDAQEIFINLIYKGDLGKEKDIAVAVGGTKFSPGIKITPPDNGCYALKSWESDAAGGVINMEDWALNGYHPFNPFSVGYDEICVNVENTTPEVLGISMNSVSMHLTINYKIPNTNPWEKPAPTNYVTKTLIFYPTSALTIPRGRTQEICFDSSDGSELPLYATDITLKITYTDTVIHKKYAGYKDISETTPIALVNVTDTNCIDSLLYTDLDSAMAAVNQDGGNFDQEDWDVFEHNMQDINIRLSSIENRQDAVLEEGEPFSNTFNQALLTPTNVLHLYVLTDYQFYMSVKAGYSPVDSRDIYPFYYDDDDNHLNLHGRTYHASAQPKLYNAAIHQAPIDDPLRPKITEMPSFVNNKVLIIEFFNNYPWPDPYSDECKEIFRNNYNSLPRDTSH